MSTETNEEVAAYAMGLDHGAEATRERLWAAAKELPHDASGDGWYACPLSDAYIPHGDSDDDRGCTCLHRQVLALFAEPTDITVDDDRIAVARRQGVIRMAALIVLLSRAGGFVEYAEAEGNSIAETYGGAENVGVRMEIIRSESAPTTMRVTLIGLRPSEPSDLAWHGGSPAHG